MRLLLTLLSVVMLVLLSRCGGPDRQARADAICGCLQGLEQRNRELAHSIASGEEDSVTDQLLEISREAGAVRICLQEQGVPGGEALRRDAALVALLDQQCPYWAGMLAALPPE